MKHEQKLEALVARTRALDEEITKANAVDASHKQAFDQLVADVESYNATTKRFDISVEQAKTGNTGPVQPSIAMARHWPKVQFQQSVDWIKDVCVSPPAAEL